MITTTLLAVFTSLAFLPAPTEDTGLQTTRISDNVFVVTGNFYEEHMTAIATGEGLVVVDTLTTPTATREARELIEQFSDEPIRYLINTHIDVDHSAGNQVFPEAVIIGHTNCRDHFNDVFFVDPDNAEQLREFIRYLEEQIELLEPDSIVAARYSEYLVSYRSMLVGFTDFVFTPPDIYIESGATISLGEISIEILYSGPGHTDADFVIFIPHEQLLVTGDLLLGRGYIPTVHHTAGGSPANLVSILDGLLEMSGQVEYVVPGHGRITNLSAATEQRDYLLALREAVVESRSRGLTLDQAKEEIVLEQYVDYMIYDLAHASNIEAVWHELEEGD